MELQSAEIRALELDESMNYIEVLVAGMPSPLPDDITTALSLTTPIRERLQSISFFLAGLLVFTIAIQGMWNYLAIDFRWMPQLNFGRAITLVVLLGTLFVLVLTMISGARELLTPGAWKKVGWTYKLQSTDAAVRERDPAQIPSISESKT